MTHSGVKSIP